MNVLPQDWSVSPQKCLFLLRLSYSFFSDLKDLKKENDFNVFCSITKCKSGRKEQKQVFFQDIVNIDVGVLKF